MQGLPVYLPETSPFYEFLHFRSMLPGLLEHRRTIMRIVGNSMCAPQAGSAAALALFTCDLAAFAV